MQTKLVALSDLHIGEPIVSNFKYSDREISNLLIKLNSDYDKIILCGDVYETWQAKKIDFYESFKKAKNRFPLFSDTLSKLINTGKVIYITGNHDRTVFENKDLYENRDFLFGKIYKRFDIELKVPEGIFNIMFIHGDELDPENDSDNSIGRWTAWSVGWLERAGWKKAETKLLNVLGKIQKGRDASNESYKTKIYEHELFKKYRAVVMGHTHKIEIENKNGIVYCNTGACIDRVDGYLEAIQIDHNESSGVSFKEILLKV